MPDKLPTGWTRARFRDAMRLEDRREPMEPDRTYKLLGVRWYGNGAFLREERLGEGLSAQHIYRVQPGDVIYNRLFAWKGSFGLIGEDLAGCYVSNEFPLFAARLDSIDPQFLLLVLQHPRTSERADAFSTGTTSISRNRLNEDDFLHFPLNLPPLAEQRAIAEVVGAVEKAIAKTAAIIEAIVDAKHATMRELLTRGIRRAKAPIKGLPNRWVLGRIAEDVTHLPSDWELLTLTKVAKLESGHTPDRKEPTYWDGSIPWISLQDADALGKLTISETAETIGPEGLANSSARMLPAGTVVLQRTANVGLASIMGREMCTSQHFANWICGPKLHPQYLQQVFRHMSREWLRLIAGSVLPDIYMDTFKALQILVPPLQEQKKIGEVGAAFDRRIEHERDTLKALVQNRAALAQELLSGRLRLPDSMIARYRDKSGKAA
jgi:type I restriction enzyme S subunit